MTEKLQKNWVYIVLALMIALQLGSIIYYFHVHKQGYHSDEIWSYGYANSYYEKHIYVDDNNEWTYTDEWLDTQVLKDYVVVNEGEQFTYDSVYNNQVYDLSPPFHSMVLHTICSFFPEQYSRWFSFSINIISFVLTMIFLFKIAKMHSNNDVFSICCCALYGFSLGARDTFIYLRMYAMCTALAMIIIYNIFRFLQNYQKTHKLIQRNLIVACVVSYIAFLTHFYMLSFMGIMTFFICAVAFLKKEYKLTFGYGFSMLLMFVLTVIVFPTMFQTAEYNAGDATATMNYNFEMRLRILADFVMTKLFNISVPISSEGYLKIAMGVLVFVSILCIPLVYLLRETKVVKKIGRMLRLCVKSPCQILRYFERRINWFYIILLLSVAGQIVVVGETAKVHVMGPIVDRYIFFLYPCVVLVGLALLYQVVRVFFRKKKIAKGILVFCSLLLVGINIYNCTQYGDYLFRRRLDGNIEDYIADRKCIFVRNAPWMLTTMVPTLIEADEFAMIQYMDYSKIEDLYIEKSSEGPIYVLIDASFTTSLEEEIETNEISGEVEADEEAKKQKQLYEDMLQLLEDLDPHTEMKYVTGQYILNRPMVLYVINP